MITEFVSYLTEMVKSDTVFAGALAAWLAAFLTGENGSLVVLVVSYQGYIEPFLAAVFIFLGSLCADLFWYFMARYAIRPWYLRRKENQLDKAGNQSYVTFADRHPYTALVFMKFLISLRIILTVYIVTRKNIPLLTFLVLNSIANVLFVSVLGAVAYFIHQGTDMFIGAGAFTAMRLIATIIGVIIVGQILFLCTKFLITKYMAKEVTR